MIITKIESQKKNKGRSSVYIDDSFAFGLSDFDVLRLHLKVGKTLTEADVAAIRQDILLADSRQYALHLLDRHSYTEAAMCRKLRDRGTDEETILNVISFLKGYHYIDDEDYARRYIKAALHAGKSGLKKIQYDLVGKGVDKDIIETVISELSEEEFDEMVAIMPILQKKLRGDYSFQNKMKAKRYLLSRGFSVDSIDHAMQKTEEESSSNETI
ncbi:MAG: RecX family transcriptional regulator [Clostridia bacterium]|nr:RecX family transcriptional regulator [Clostridia bacterium]